VSITREAVKLEEQAVKKSVLNLKQDGKDYKLGVIEIPAFYLDFKAFRAGDPDYKSTTRDVKKLLTELQKKSRRRGHRPAQQRRRLLQEATELTSLFIDKGPTVLVRNAMAASTCWKTKTRRLLQRPDGAAGQPPVGLGLGDFRRRHAGLPPRLIIGGQTFGKGTVQTIQPLNHGELKLTLAKFYRVSGQSTQHQGVLPDIDYPSIIDTKEIGESALPEAMPWDTIRPAIKPASDRSSRSWPAQGEHDTQRQGCRVRVHPRQAGPGQKLMEEKPSASTKPTVVPSTPTSKPSNWRWRTSAARPRAKSRSKS
jgi:carboxyl-terminal processing protease